MRALIILLHTQTDSITIYFCGISISGSNPDLQPASCFSDKNYKTVPKKGFGTGRVRSAGAVMDTATQRNNLK